MRPDQDAIEALARELYELWADSDDPEWDALPSTDDVRADYIITAVRLADTYLAKMPKAWAVKIDGTPLGPHASYNTKYWAEREAQLRAGSRVVPIALVEIPEGE